MNFPLDGFVYLQIAADHPVIRRVGGSRGLCETSLRGDWRDGGSRKDVCQEMRETGEVGSFAPSKGESPLIHCQAVFSSQEKLHDAHKATCIPDENI